MNNENITKYCENCGANIPKNVTECPFCGAKLQEIKEAATKEVVQPKNPLLGKEYSFNSTRGIRFGLFSVINNKVSVSEDRLFIQTFPKKCNCAPSVLFEDITGITITNQFALMYIIYAIISSVTVVGVPFFLWCGSNKKITISQRNGKDIILYSATKAVAEEFKNDMRVLAKIQ